MFHLMLRRMFLPMLLPKFLRSRSLIAVLFALACVPAIAHSQQPSDAASQSAADSTSQATSILNQSLSASGMAANAVQGFTATGQITYYWGGQAVQANATIRAKGGDQFRLDADVPGGTKSISFSHRTGSSKEPDGTASAIPAHNTLTAGVLTFPYLSIASALSDPSVVISYIGSSIGSSVGSSIGPSDAGGGSFIRFGSLESSPQRPTPTAL